MRDCHALTKESDKPITNVEADTLARYRLLSQDRSRAVEIMFNARRKHGHERNTQENLFRAKAVHGAKLEKPMIIDRLRTTIDGVPSICHGKLNKHLMLLALEINDTCRFCEKTKEAPEHLLKNCEALI